MQRFDLSILHVAVDRQQIDLIGFRLHKVGYANDLFRSRINRTLVLVGRVGDFTSKEPSIDRVPSSHHDRAIMLK